MEFDGRFPEINIKDSSMEFKIESGYGKMTGRAHFIFRKVRATYLAKAKRLPKAHYSSIYFIKEND